MLVLTLFIFLLSSSQAFLQHGSEFVRDEDGSLRDILSEHAHGFVDIDDRDDDEEEEDDDEDDYNRYKLMQVLKSMKNDLEHRYKRQQRIKPYENYDIGEDQDNKKKIRAAYEDITHKHFKKKKKEISKKKVDSLTNDELKKAKKQEKDAMERKKVYRKKEILHGNAQPSVHERDTVGKKAKQYSDDNNQVASVKIDDSVEKQQALINEINPRDVFLEAGSNKTGNKTKGAIHAHVKTPPIKVTSNKRNKDGLDRVSFIAVVVGCCVAGLAGIGLAGYCWFKLRQESKYLEETQRGISTKEKKSSRKGSGKKAITEDEKLAENAEVFHYLHAKKQMQQMEEPLKKVEKFSGGETTDEEDEDTVYECPGLAPPGDMKVVNPLFSDAESHHSDRQSDTQSHGSTPTPTEIENVNADVKLPSE